MKNKMLYLLSLGLAFAMLSTTAAAQIAQPHQFYGKVTTNGAPGPNGLYITAMMDGEVVASTTSRDGTYGIDPRIFYVDDPDGTRNGLEMAFYIEGVEVAQYVFSNGGSTELDLSIVKNLGLCADNYCSSDESCSSCPADCGTCAASGGTSSGGSRRSSGGSSAQNAACEENWTCSAWSTCTRDGKQFRSCTDENACGTDDDIPEEISACIYAPSEAQKVCQAGTKICLGNELRDCPDGTYWETVKTCKYGCDPTALACLTASGEAETGTIFDAISAFFGSLFGGGTSGAQATGFSVASSGMFIAGAVIVVMLVILAVFFMRKKQA